MDQMGLREQVYHDVITNTLKPVLYYRHGLYNIVKTTSIGSITKSYIKTTLHKGHLKVIKLIYKYDPLSFHDDSNYLETIAYAGHKHILLFMLNTSIVYSQHTLDVAAIYTIVSCHLDVIKILIDHGANITAYDNYILAIAMNEKPNIRMVRFLLDHGVDPNSNNAISDARDMGLNSIVKLLETYAANRV
jgi:ankyrin repeat protein